MSKDQTEKVKSVLQISALAVSFIGGLAGIFAMIGTFYLLPFKIDLLEKRVAQFEIHMATDHDTLTRIEERLKAVQAAVQKLEKP